MRALAILLIAPLLVPLALADETRADCEANQPWIGYSTTDEARYQYENHTTSAPAQARNCEGEQWDGQDAGAASCPVELLCQPADPNSGNADVFAGGMPARLRAGAITHGGAEEVYVSYDVWLVARGAVYAGHCAGGEGLETAETCGGTHNVRTGVYWRDNTPSNLVVNAASCSLSITRCFIGETDCQQTTYAADRAGGGDPRRCGRDNTAVGSEVWLP